MPALKQLIEELTKLRVDPDEVRLSGVLRDSFIEEDEDTIEENTETED